MAAAVANGGATLPRQPTAAPGQSAATAATIAALQIRPLGQQQQQPRAAGPGTAAPVPGPVPLRPGYGFTPAQLTMLRNQIMAFRSLKVRRDSRLLNTDVRRLSQQM